VNIIDRDIDLGSLQNSRILQREDIFLGFVIDIEAVGSSNGAIHLELLIFAHCATNLVCALRIADMLNETILVYRSLVARVCSSEGGALEGGSE
jgi:hypothetical protein